jgi:hypothetical protein
MMKKRSDRSKETLEKIHKLRVENWPMTIEQIYSKVSDGYRSIYVTILRFFLLLNDSYILTIKLVLTEHLEQCFQNLFHNYIFFTIRACAKGLNNF